MVDVMDTSLLHFARNFLSYVQSDFQLLLTNTLVPSRLDPTNSRKPWQAFAVERHT